MQGRRQRPCGGSCPTAVELSHDGDHVYRLQVLLASCCATVPDLNCCAQRSEKNKQLGILRAKVPLDGWVYGEGERTLLRQLDGGEDDGALLRVDFARLRGVSAHL